MHADVFVGRDGLIAEMLDAVGGADPLVVFVVGGVGGVGRSALLDQVDLRLASADARVLRVRFAELVPEGGEEPLTIYRAILEALAPQLDPAGAGEFSRQARRRAEVATTRAAVDVARDDIRDAFLELTGADAAALAVLGDDLSALSSTVAGWFLDLLRQLARRTRTVAILTRAGAPRDGTAYPGRVVPVTLGALERAEAEAFLAGSGVDQRWYGPIERWSGHYPAAVVAAAKLAREHPDRPEVLYDPSVVAPRCTELVTTLMSSLHDQSEQRALEVATVMRRFDADALVSVLAVAGVVAPPTLEDWLAELPFLERLADGRDRVRPFVRDLVSVWLRTQPPRGPDPLATRLDEVHDLVTRHYEQRVLKDAQARSYRSWLTIEDRAAQEQQLEFLHHALLMPDENRFGRFRLARAWFDAFWWWGAYCESDFCRRLLDASEREADGRNRQFLATMRKFEAAYPPESSGREPNWDDVRAAVGEIAEAIGIAGRVTELTPPEAHVRAILEMFRGMGHAGLRDASAAEECFTRADDLFRRNPDDRWCLPWVRVYQASLAARSERLEEALEQARAGLRLATEGVADEERDYEVEASLHREIADVLWQRGERWTAFRHLAKAVFFAYAFTAIPDPPDEYTQSFYREVSEGAVGRILELLPDVDRAHRACSAFAEFWSPYWELAGQRPDEHSIEVLLRTSPHDVAYCVLPAAPSDDDLEYEGGYAVRARRVHDALRPALDQATEAFGHEPIVTRLRSAFRRRHETVAEVPAPELPQESAEPPALFEASDDPVWPDHWRVFPEAWRELGADDPERADVRAVFERALAELPPVWREVLRRRDGDGWSYEDVARRLGVSHKHQTLILHHAHARLRSALASRFAKEAQ
jgi:DNA-directed RNA polymerase specialized sigma24 family protein